MDCGNSSIRNATGKKHRSSRRSEYNECLENPRYYGRPYERQHPGFAAECLENPRYYGRPYERHYPGLGLEYLENYRYSSRHYERPYPGLSLDSFLMGRKRSGEKHHEKNQPKPTVLRFDGGLSNTVYQPGPSIDLGTAAPNPESPNCPEVPCSAVPFVNEGCSGYEEKCDKKYIFDGGNAQSCPC